MDVVSITATTVVGLSFVIAGASKLVAREQWRSDALGFGAPRWVIPSLPWLELAVGAAVLVMIEPAVSVGAAALVLVAFTVAILLNLARGRRPPCACFGAWSSSPIGWRQVARNVVLIAACGLALL